jgi:imidazolonepropionase-like amidohydrolase
MIALVFASLVVAAPVAITDVKVEVGDGTVIDKATVVVDGGKIVAVGPAVKTPAGALVVDGKGKVLTPGLVSVGAQTGLFEIELEQQTVDYRMSGDAVPGFRAIDGFNPSSPRVAIDREQGITTEILSPRGTLLAGQGYAVDLAGDMATTTRARRVAMFGSFGADAKSAGGGARGGVWLRLRELLDDARFFDKNRAAYDRADARTLSLSRVHLEALVDVVNGKLPVVFDADRASDIEALLAFAKEQKIKVIVNGGAEAWAVASDLAAAKVPVVLVPSSAEPYSFDALRARDDSAAVLAKAGVQLLISSGASGTTTTRARQEAGVAVAYGLAHAEAIRAITLAPAQAFGLDKDLGTVAVGKRADLVLWSGDPLEAMTAAERVWIGGEPMSVDTRQKALAERYRKRGTR